MSRTDPPPQRVLRAFGFESATVAPIEIGLINRTYRVDARSGRYALQRVNPMFPAEVNDDIDAITRALTASGVPTPTLLEPASGGPCHVGEDGVWRALTWIDGVVHERLSEPEQAREAGAVLGRFHAGVSEWNGEFRSARVGVHDTARHLRHLADCVRRHRDHRAHTEIETLAGEILELARSLPILPPLPERVVHGDPKVTNVIFDQQDRGLCLVDLDTVSRMTTPLELGDALRSWCNRAGEDADEANVSEAFVRSAFAGYHQTMGPLLLTDEWKSFVAGLQIISLELASRFCADALTENYFAWNRDRYGSATEHNLVRARGQVSLSRHVAKRRKPLEAIADDVFG